jgi:hypothetical protein
MRILAKTALIAGILLMLSASALGYEFGTKVGVGDKDVGTRTIFLTDDPMNIKFWNINGMGYDSKDPIYLVDPSPNHYKLRLSWFGTYLPGTIVQPGDDDYCCSLLTPFVNPDIVYLDLFGTKHWYDWCDPVIFIDNTASGRIETFDLRLTTVNSYRPGTKILDFHPDHNKYWSSFPFWAIRYAEIDGQPGLTCYDHVYLTFSGKDEVAPLDVRLTPV